MAGLDLARKTSDGEFFTMSWRERRRRKEERKRELAQTHATGGNEGLNELWW